MGPRGLSVDPGAEAERRRTLVALLVCGIVGFALLAVLYRYAPLDPLDHDVARWVSRHTPGWAESMGRAASDVGSMSAWLVAGVVVIGLVVLRRFRDAVWAAVTFAGIHVLVAALKDAFDRPRPQGASAIPLPGSPSFPSGHAAGSVVTFGVLAALAAERWPAYRHLLWALAAVLAAAIGASRVILDVHFVTDVVAGWCLGIAWLAAALLVRDALVSRRAAAASSPHTDERAVSAGAPR